MVGIEPEDGDRDAMVAVFPAGDTVREYPSTGKPAGSGVIVALIRGIGVLPVNTRFSADDEVPAAVDDAAVALFAADCFADCLRPVPVFDFGTGGGTTADSFLGWLCSNNERAIGYFFSSSV